MLLLITKSLLTLFAELAGIACTAGILYLYWNCMTKNTGKALHLRLIRGKLVMFIQMAFFRL